MALPKQVQRQLDEMNAYEQQVADAKAANEPKPDDPPQTEDNSPKPVENASQPVDNAPKPTGDDDPNNQTWRQRYQSLQGQFNSQVPALQQQIQQLTDTVGSLTAKLEQQVAQPPKVEEPTELVTKTDVDAFGEDLVDLARRIAKEEFGKRESKYLKQIEALEGKLTEAKGQVGEVKETQAAATTERFFENLTRQLPTWEQVQATPECQDWLGTRIPGVGITWNQALQNAASTRDVPAVMEVFEAFFERYPNMNPKAVAQTQTNSRQELNRQVAPSKTSASNPQSTQKRTYTVKEYEQESMKIMRLMQQNKKEEVRRLEAELDAALAEGRVVP
jgi:hypothetical protein